MPPPALPELQQVARLGADMAALLLDSQATHAKAARVQHSLQRLAGEHQA